jgi:copper ion binding protein
VTRTQTFQVDGMTCDHCVHAVTDELQALAGVKAVDVDLAAGTVTVDSNRALSDEEVSDALDEAGAYALA